MISAVTAQGRGGGTSRIGHAIEIRGQVESNVQGRAYPLARGGSVVSDQWVNTRESSVAGLGMLDDSKIYVGPKSSIKLDKSRFDPAKQGGIVSLRIRQGTQALVKVAPTDRAAYHVRDPNGRLVVSR